ncbi:MAG: deoxyribodipyrimidine photo-lyase [Gammaproteobacteria bacterium]|nr:deoxyribodipyrimidine photo-lyase [Gammaproteobacteria bacterium]
MIEQARVKCLNDEAPDDKGRYVLYWMQQTQRAHFNPALEHAARLANDRDQPLVVVFGLMEKYPEANERHFAFMLEGLSETEKALRKRRIKMVTLRSRPDVAALKLAKQASLVVCDRGYLRHQRKWRKRVADEAGRCVMQVEGDAVVPVEAASDKAEFAARTIRPKLKQQRDDYLGGLSETKLKNSSLKLKIKSDLDVSDPEKLLKKLRLDRKVGRVEDISGGTKAARAELRRFLSGALNGYAKARNDPVSPRCSKLSPYLHFGQISPVEVARKVIAAKGPSKADKDAFLEELIVRRELAINHVYYRKKYDHYDCLPDWAKKTLSRHKRDKRPQSYSRKSLEQSKTDDEYWNAAMTEMRISGYLHNHMRMYWGKKILEWSNTPQYAFKTALYLNNKYFLDGRDANSYANVAWIFGLHDRPWQERKVFGKVRYMNAKGLERKFDVAAYVKAVKARAGGDG